MSRTFGAAGIRPAAPDSGWAAKQSGYSYRISFVPCPPDRSLFRLQLVQ